MAKKIKTPRNKGAAAFDKQRFGADWERARRIFDQDLVGADFYDKVYMKIAQDIEAYGRQCFAAGFTRGIGADLYIDNTKKSKRRKK